MPMIEHFCRLAGIKPGQLSKHESLVIESSLLVEICDELIFRLTITQKEKNMSYGNLIYYLLRDLINTKDYTVSGVANYTDVPEDVINDISIGTNANPSLNVARKIIELHKNTRTDLYQHVMQKITDQYASDEDHESA